LTIKIREDFVALKNKRMEQVEKGWYIVEPGIAPDSELINEKMNNYHLSEIEELGERIFKDESVEHGDKDKSEISNKDKVNPLEESMNSQRGKHPKYTVTNL